MSSGILMSMRSKKKNTCPLSSVNALSDTVAFVFRLHAQGLFPKVLMSSINKALLILNDMDVRISNKLVFSKMFADFLCFNEV